MAYLEEGLVPLRDVVRPPLNSPILQIFLVLPRGRCGIVLVLGGPLSHLPEDVGGHVGERQHLLDVRALFDAEVLWIAIFACDSKI